jgi:hypothetical protein
MSVIDSIDNTIVADSNPIQIGFSEPLAAGRSWIFRQRGGSPQHAAHDWRVKTPEFALRGRSQFDPIAWH